MISNFFGLCAFTTVCIFIASANPAEAGRRGSTDTDPPPPVVVDDEPIVSAQ